MYILLAFVSFLVAAGNVPLVKGENTCVLVPFNGSFLIHQSTLVKIYQINLNFEIPESFSIEINSTNENGIRFKPNRWFLLRGERSNRLLLLLYYYYNFLNTMISVSTQSLNMDVTQSPANCLASLNDVDRDLLLRRWFVNASNVPRDSGIAPIDEVCSMSIKNYYTLGVLQYHCCRLEDVNNCFDVEEDALVWVLRIFIIVITIFIFFYFPNFIPRNYGRLCFAFFPTQVMEFRIVVTRNPDKYIVKGQTVHSAIFKQMTKLVESLRNVSEDVIHNAKVKSVDLFIQRGAILSEHDESVNLFQFFYEYIIRCKIRNVASMKQCCNDPICGRLCSRRPCLWWEFLDGLKTVAIYLLIALPAVPLLYSLSADDLEYEELARKLSKHGLHQTSSFYIGEYAGKVVVAVLGVLYVIHILIVILANSIHEELTNLMDDTVSEWQNKRKPITETLSHTLLSPFKRFSVFYFPIFVIGILLSPLIAFLYLLITSPVAKLIWRQCTKFCFVERLRYKKYTNPTVCGPKVSFCLFLTLLSVFVILTIGFNFLLHVICILLVYLLINISSLLSGISLVFLLFVYIRDTTSRLEAKYSDYHKALLGEVMGRNTDSVMTEARKEEIIQGNTAFQYGPDDFNIPDEMESERVNLQRNVSWDVNEGYLRMHTNGIVLLLDKYDVPYIPYKFFRDMTEIQCSGCPGTLQSSVINSAKEIGKIVLFLLFLLILILAYGDTVYVSPTSKLFATVATGLIPLSLRSFFFNRSSGPGLDTSTLRFKYLFQHNVLKFMNKWTVSDFNMSYTFCPTKEGETYTDALWNDPAAVDAVDVQGTDPTTVNTQAEVASGKPGEEPGKPEEEPEKPEDETSVSAQEPDVNYNKVEVNDDLTEGDHTKGEINYTIPEEHTNRPIVDILFDLSTREFVETDVCVCCRSTVSNYVV